MINLDRKKTALLVIDIQEKLANSMSENALAKMLAQTKILIQAAEILELPIIESLQYKKGLGESVSGLFGDESKTIKRSIFEKTSFSCEFKGSPLNDFLDSHIRQIIICGMEAHVCVLQTARDLAEKGYEIALAKDCIISRAKSNYKNALDVMAQFACVLNTESILFDLLKDAKSAEFKAISKLIK